jgi:hypothetical protein
MDVELAAAGNPSSSPFDSFSTVNVVPISRVERVPFST